MEVVHFYNNRIALPQFKYYQFIFIQKTSRSVSDEEYFNNMTNMIHTNWILNIPELDRPIFFTRRL